MNKRRVLLGCFIATMSLVLSACDFLPENFLPTRRTSSQESSSQRSRPSRNPTSSSSGHTHRFSESWNYNATSHWHDAICGHDLKSDFEQHSYYYAVTREPTCNSYGEQVQICTVCDYRIVTSIPMTDHSWHEYSHVEPTCYESGLSKRYCTICGESREEYIPPLGHEYETISYQAPTCSQSGYCVNKCKRCGEETEQVMLPAAHSWGEQSTADYGEGSLPYTIRICNVCGVTRISIKAQDGVLNGKYRSSTALDYGYIKLSANGNYISYTFNYPNVAFGKMYQHAVFDSSSYYGYTYKTGATNGNDYNFEALVNGNVVDLSESGNITYNEFLDNGEYIEGLTGNGFSPAADCLIGDVALVQGLNTFTFTRTGSYNLCVDYFYFDIFNSDHAHTASDYWQSNDTSHWHTCTDANCPMSSVKLDNEPHSFGETMILSEPTCNSDGVQRQICSVCQYCYDTIIPSTGHTYTNIGAFEKVDESVYLEEYDCQGCDQYALRWNALSYDTNQSQYIENTNDTYIRFQSGMAENLNGEPQTGAHLVYQIYSLQNLSNVGLAFNIVQTNGTVFETSNTQGYIYDDYGNLVPATKKYGLKVNGINIVLGEDVYGSRSYSFTKAWYDWPVTFDLVAGMNTIDIVCLNTNYRANMYEFQITGVPYIEPNHTHVAGNNLQFDSNAHYYLCTSGDGVRMNEEPHTFTEYVTVTEPTCDTNGSMVRTCTVCGYEDYLNINPNGHSWDEGTIITDSTHTSDGEILYTCQVCGAQKTEIIPAGHSWGEAQNVFGDAIQHECSICGVVCYELNLSSPQKLKQDVTWNVAGLPAGTYEVYLSACVASTTLSQNIVSGETARYQFGFDNYEGYASPASGTYESYGFGTGTSISNVKWTNALCEVVANEGASSFTVHYSNAGYSAFIAAVRLIKVA